jgi:tetratricopeptide (TPR) repeat protein
MPYHLKPVVAPAAPATANKAGLPSEETAKICVATGELLEQDGKKVEAIAMFVKARQLDPSLQSLCRRLAVLYDEVGEFRQAQEEYDQALQLYPKDAALLNDLGYSYYCRGRWAEAEQNLNQALAINPKLERAWINLGMTLGQQGRYAESLEAFGKAVRPAQALCNLAFIYTTQGKRDEARQAYRQALAQNPDLRLARAALAKLESAGPAAPAEQLATGDGEPNGGGAGSSGHLLIPAVAHEEGRTDGERLIQPAFAPPAIPAGFKEPARKEEDQ